MAILFSKNYNFWQFLTFKWQFSGGSSSYSPRILLTGQDPDRHGRTCDPAQPALPHAKPRYTGSDRWQATGGH